MLSDLRAGGRPGLHVPQAPPAQKILPGRTNSVTLKMYRRYFYLRYFLTSKNIPPSEVKKKAKACRHKKGSLNYQYMALLVCMPDRSWRLG
jgi:hypothetical protein